MNWIDLHIHSTASDGTTEPEKIPKEILKTVEKHGDMGKYEKYILALTDHDTLAGVRRIKKAVKNDERFQVYSGVEISCDYCGKEIHMLGLNVDEENELLLERLKYYRGFRDRRNEKIIEKFAEQGITIHTEEIVIKEGETMGRPHIARYLMKHGYVSSVKEAFDLYLADGKSCYVKREKATIEEAINLILNAGGYPVLAHPMQYKKFTREELEVFVKELKELGLWGIETYYTDFSEEEIEFVETLSEKYTLKKTGGSDYHGYNKPDIELGYGRGNLDAYMGKIQVKEPDGNINKI